MKSALHLKAGTVGFATNQCRRYVRLSKVVLQVYDVSHAARQKQIISVWQSAIEQLPIDITTYTHGQCDLLLSTSECEMRCFN